MKSCFEKTTFPKPGPTSMVFPITESCRLHPPLALAAFTEESVGYVAICCLGIIQSLLSCFLHAGFRSSLISFLYISVGKYTRSDDIQYQLHHHPFGSITFGIPKQRASVKRKRKLRHSNQSEHLRAKDFF